MSIIDRILGRGAGEAPRIQAASKPAVTDLPATAATVPASASPAGGEGVVRVYDQFGRKLEIGREAWRRDVLLPNLAANRGNPDALAELISGALSGDFAADALEAARYLYEHDPRPQRGAALLGAVLLETRDFPAARAVLERAIERHGESVYLLANLARAFAAAGDDERAQSLIWRALQLDPNEKSALDWTIASANARGGQEAALAAYTRAAALPGSWRAQLWLARYSLAGGQLDEAIGLYEQALGRATPPPADLLMQLSGDLGNAGHTELLVRLTQPRFDLAAHGLEVGNNLLRAYIDLGMFAEARKLLEQLYSRQRPDWRDQLIVWERTLDDAQRRYGEVLAPLEIELITLEHPVWAHGVLGFESLLPPKAADSPRVHFFCGSGEMQSQAGDKVIAQPTNDLGRIVRALPMFLAEELQLRTSARTAFLLPWVKQGGFIVSAKQWTRGSLPPDAQPADLFVYLHVDARATPWRLILTLDHPGSAAAVLEHEFDLANAGHDVLTLLYALMSKLGQQVILRREESAAALGTPPAALLPGYLAALEQALAIALAARHVGNESFLHQERSIFDHLFEVALQGAELLRPRLMLVNALENETRRRPDIAREYLPKLSLLQLRHALAAGPGTELVAKGVQRVVEKVGAA